MLDCPLMDQTDLARTCRANVFPAIASGKAISDSQLAALATSSPVAAYVRSLTSDAGRSSTMQAICVAADHLAPGVLPPSAGRGRGGNGSVRFLRACALPFHELRTDRLAEFRASLMRSGLAPATVNRIIAAVKGVLQHCWQSGLFDGETMSRCKASLKSVRGSTLPKGRHIPKAEIARLFQVISRSPNPAASRDAAIIALMCIGLRRAEIAALHMADYQQDNGRLIVRGKGGKERAVFLTNGAKAAVEDWMAVRGAQPSDELLLAVDKAGSIVPHGITAQSVYASLQRRASEAGLRMTPHDFRRSFIGEALGGGVDVVTVQHLVGHSSPSTTARYDRRGEEVKRSAMAVVSVPYVSNAA